MLILSMSINRKFWRLHLAIFTSLFFFQNCSWDSSQLNLTNSASTTNKSLAFVSNNGTGYDGKPDGHYYNYMPSFECQGSQNFVNGLTINEQKVDLVKNLPMKCGYQALPLSMAEIDTSPFQPGLVGYRDKIFEHSQNIFSKTPDRLVEAWCFNANGVKNFEVIQSYNFSTQQSKAQIYSRGDSGDTTVPSFQTRRLVDKNDANFSSDSYSMTVHRQKIATAPGIFSADLNAMINGQTTQVQLACRIGGYLDADLWPSKVIMIDDVFDFYNNHSLSSADGSSFYTSAKDNSGLLTIFKKSLNSANGAEPLPNLIASGDGIDNFRMASDQTHLVYLNDQVSPFDFEFNNRRHLFVYDINSSSAWPIGSAETLAARIDGDIRIIKDMVYYTELVVVSYTQRRLYLKRVHLDGSNPITIYDSGIYSLSDRSLSNRPYLTLLNDSDPLIFEVNDFNKSWRRLYSVANSSPTVKSITPDFTDSLNMYDSTPVFSSKDSSYVLYPVSAKSVGQSIGDITTRMTATDGTAKSFLEMKGAFFSQISLYDASKTYVIGFPTAPPAGVSGPSSQIAYIIDPRSWAFVPAPVLQSMQASADNHAFYGLSELGELYKVNSGSGLAARICPSLSAIQRLVSPPCAPSNLYFLTNIGKLMGVYRLSSGDVCTLVNQIPLSADSYPNLVISPNEASAVIVTGLTQTPGEATIYGAKNSMIWVPLNGKAPVKLSTPDIESVFTSEARFSNDSNSVVFSASGGTDHLSKIYQWTVPAE
jgi:hypothetical protein